MRDLKIYNGDKVILKKNSSLSWIIAISPILLQYHFVFSTYGLILLTIVYVILMVNRKKIFFDKDFIKLSVILLIQQVTSMLIFNSFSSSYINTLITTEIMCFVVAIGFCVKDKDDLYDKLKKVAIVCTVIIYLQFILHTFMNVEYKPITLIPQNSQHMLVWVTNRPSGLFSEPQTYATFAIIIFIMALQRKEIRDFNIISYWNYTNRF